MGRSRSKRCMGVSNRFGKPGSAGTEHQHGLGVVPVRFQDRSGIGGRWSVVVEMQDLIREALRQTLMGIAIANEQRRFSQVGGVGDLGCLPRQD